jgi:hypothetical protein
MTAAVLKALAVQSRRVPRATNGLPKDVFDVSERSASLSFRFPPPTFGFGSSPARVPAGRA